MAVHRIDEVTNGAEASASRRTWTTPALVTHESLTVLTQHYFGPLGALLALQVNCSVPAGGGPIVCH